jgi:hypothetical protein
MKFEPFKLVLTGSSDEHDEAWIGYDYVTIATIDGSEICSRHSVLTSDILKIADAIRMAAQGE